MRHALPLVALVAALFTFTGCDDGTCEDADGDGFGIGGSCEATDCNDSDPLHHSDCLSCSDPDKDGRGVGCDLGSDCAASDDRHWADCGNCTDVDRDGYGVGCDRGEDCGDDDPDQFTTCSACVDADGDGSFAGCEAYVNRPGPDCDDADPDNYLRCDFCGDVDGDGRFANCDRYSAHMGPDCNDTDANNWDSCGTCRDMDADTYSSGCDAYAGDLKGPDCNDSNALHWSDCGSCTDSDGDGRGTGTCDLGFDPCDSNSDAWMTASCAACIDSDTDGRYAGCDAYFTRAGPDCDDADPNSWFSCATCVDLDTDAHYTGCDTYTTAKPFDCNDGNPNAYTSTGCALCRDNDSDTYYTGCDAYTTVLGPDCGDSDVNNWTSCSTCTDTDADTYYATCDAYTTITGPDCDPSSGLHWSDCGNCTDLDGDGRGAGACDLGTDCDETSDLHWSDCTTCTDVDGDGYGSGVCDVGASDCDDNNVNRNPGLADATINGIDENCDLLDGLPFVDDFEDGVYTPQWTSVIGDTSIQTVYRVSGSYALTVGGGIGNVDSAVLDTSSCGAVTWRYYAKRGPEEPDLSNENLAFSYWTGSVWTLINTVVGGATDPAFNTYSGVITSANALHAGFRVRFQTTGGSGTCCDDHYVDDVVVGCAVDTDGDATADLLDCAPLDDRHWSDCGVCVDGDNDGYGTGCNLGADCAGFDNDAARNPAASDLTIDGIDQNCNGFDGIQTSTVSSSSAVGITDGAGEAADCAAVGASTSQVVSSGAGTLTSVDVTLNVTHALTSDLDVWLRYTSATGSPVCVQLTTDNGAGANYTSTVFSDSGTTAITAGASPFTGTFQPESVLSTLDSRARAGTWTLYVNDDTATNIGTLTGWSVQLSYY